MRIGIYTHYIDKYPRTAPSLYQTEFIRRLIEKTSLEVVLIHHKKLDFQIYRLAEEVRIPKLPYLREREMDKLNLDLIHFNAIPWSWWPTLAKLDPPSIATVHGTIHWDAPHLDDYTPPILRAIKKTLEKRAARHITHFIAISRHVRDVLVGKLNIPSSKVEVVYLPVDHTIFRPLDDNIVQKVKAKYRIESRYILHVSAFSKRKNPEILIKTFYIIKEKMKDLILVIVGSGWSNKHAQELINKFNLQDCVKVLGWVPTEDLIALYNGAELLLFPSLHENFGFPLVEAMACGCPVVTSNAYAIPEVVGDAAILCDPRDYECFTESILNLLQNSGLREEMAERGLRRARRFDWNDHIDKVLSVYKKVANHGT